jgi:hypothetical protein
MHGQNLIQLHKDPGKIIFVGGHWVTFSFQTDLAGNSFEVSEPVERLLLSWDDENQRLKVIVTS